MAEKWKYKRIVALKSDGLVVQIDGVAQTDRHGTDIDRMLEMYGDAGYKLIATNDTTFGGTPAIQYVFMASAGPLRD
ncbi:TPA: hypothetical protein DIU27_05545 [Candidatus Collierbacteria bacterium]|nr:hypothetical protein [Candidatus Collierbacteria bacterium]